MSCSSSTTRMSRAINRSPLKYVCGGSIGRLAAGTLGRRIAGEKQRRARPTFGRSGEVEFATVLLDDLLDDREAETGALLAGRHVGLHDPHAFLRQAHAVVGHAH